MKPNNQKPWVLITGSARRLGKSMALHLAERDFNICLHYNKSEDEAHFLREEIMAKGVLCESIECDLMDSEAVINMIEMLASDLPRMDVLINNASIYENFSFLETDLSTLENNLQVHLKAPFLLMREFAKHSQEGLIVNILDTRIKHPRKHYFAYTLSKMSLFNLTQLGALALAPKIRVNAIAPGLLLPPEGKDETYLQSFVDRVPLKRIGSEYEMNQTLDFFLENEYITGQVIYVDGGENL